MFSYAFSWSERCVYLLQGRVNDVRSKIDGELSALHAALERRKQIGAAREKLELMQDAVQLEGKVGLQLCPAGQEHM